MKILVVIGLLITMNLSIKAQSSDVGQNFAAVNFTSGTYKKFKSNSSSNAYEVGKVDVKVTTHEKYGVTKITIGSMDYNADYITKGEDTIYYAPYFTSSNYQYKMVYQSGRLLVFSVMADKTLNKLQNIIGKNTGKVSKVHSSLEAYLVEAEKNVSNYEKSMNDKDKINEALFSNNVDYLATNSKPKSKFDKLKEKAKEKTELLKGAADKESKVGEEVQKKSENKPEKQVQKTELKENKEFSISQLDPNQIAKYEIGFIGYDGKAIASRKVPGLIITMKDGSVHKDTRLEGDMIVESKNIKPVKYEYSSDYGYFLYEFYIKDKPEINAAIKMEIKWYMYDLKLNYFGSSGSYKGENGSRSKDVYLFAKKIKTETGKELIKLKEVVDGKEAIYLLDMDLTITVSSTGGSGANGAKGKPSSDPFGYSGNGGNGGNGGDGGNVIITLDPNITGKQLERFKFGSYSLRGGYGGEGAVFGDCFDCKGNGKFGLDGNNGKEGKMTITTKTVEF